MRRLSRFFPSRIQHIDVEGNGMASLKNEKLLPAIRTLVSGLAVSYEPYSIAGFCYVHDLHIVPNISSGPIQIKRCGRIEHLGRD